MRDVVPVTPSAPIHEISAPSIVYHFNVAMLKAEIAWPGLVTEVVVMPDDDESFDGRLHLVALFRGIDFTIMQIAPKVILLSFLILVNGLW